MSTKVQRQHCIEQLIAKTSISSQSQLRELMKAEGFDLSQVTVSRDLQDLGAIKIRSGEGLLYAIPELAPQRAVPADTLRRVCAEWVFEVTPSQNLVVLKTPPGSAHVVAAAIDRSGQKEVVGTLAGDDTIVVVADESVGGNKLAKMFAELADL